MIPYKTVQPCSRNIEQGDESPDGINPVPTVIDILFYIKGYNGFLISYE